VIAEVKELMEKELRDGDIILDIGCGNGEYRKYVPKSVFYIGIEKCQSMVAVEDGMHMDCLRLTFRDAVFDRVLLVAVLHHFASEETRLKTLQEVNRVLVEGGTAYVTVLSYENKKEVYSSP
jgi:SAM-dependent methyltransferase